MYAIRGNHQIRRQRPGMWEQYYDIREHLNEYFKIIVAQHGLHIRNAHRALRGTLGVTIVCQEAKLGQIKIKLPAGDDIENEVFFYEQLTQQHIPAPHVIATDISKTLIPHQYCITEFVPGHHPGKEVAGNDFAMLQNIGRQLKRVHAIRTNGFGKRVAGGWSRQNLHAMLAQLLKEKFWNNPNAEPFGKRYLATMKKLTRYPLLQIKQPRLLHGDVRSDNIVMAEAQPTVVAAFVDPGIKISGDPMSDLALATISWSGAEAKRALLNGYTDNKPLSENEQTRLALYRLFHLFWISALMLKRGRNWKPHYEKTMQLYELYLEEDWEDML